MALSQKTAKLLRSLAQKKFRDDTGLFLAEGAKLVEDLLRGGLVCTGLYTTEPWSAPAGPQPQEISPAEMKTLSQLDTPTTVLASFLKPRVSLPGILPPGMILVLDRVQNPGNLGTLLRTAHWFGLRWVFLGEGTTDPFGPKAVQSTMGSLAQLNLVGGPLEPLLEKARAQSRPIVGTFPQGENLYQAPLDPGSLVLLGNEGQGLDPRFHSFLTQRLTIPPAGNSAQPPESLNVAVAGALVMGEFFRRASV